MKDYESIIRHLDCCSKLMMSGKFGKDELKFIKLGLEKMLNATNNVIEKANKNEEKNENKN